VARHRARRHWSRAAWGLAAVALALVVAGTVAALLPSHGSPRAVPPAAGGSSSAGPGGSTDARSATAVGAELARWAGTELPRGDHLVATAGVAGALRRAGVPAGVVAAGGGGPGQPGTVLAVTDGAVPAGDRLVARFGSPPVLAVVDPAPVQPTAAELQRRRHLAAAVLANPTTRVADPAAAALRAAAVDPRLLGVLAALTASSGVGVAVLPAAPDEPADVPLARSALIDEVGGRPVTAGSPDVPALVAFLRAQLAPYAPDEVTVTPSGVLVGYRYASGPDAAVTTASY
jgi:hypothetical protein